MSPYTGSNNCAIVTLVRAEQPRDSESPECCQRARRKIGSWAFPKMILLRNVLAGVGFQDAQHFCDRLGVLMCIVA